MSLAILILFIQITFATHAVRTGRTSPWLWIIIFVPTLGCILYLVIEIGPELAASRTSRQVRFNVIDTVDPARFYRDLAKAVEITPTVHNKLLLAEECLRLGRAEEAVELYAGCAQGLHETDPWIRLGLAKAHLAAFDYAGAIEDLEALRRDTPGHRTAEGHLLYARALEGAGRVQDALAEYSALIDYFGGEEARFRYANLLLLTGDTDRANEQYREIVRRVGLQGNLYRRAQHQWYDLARRALR